MSKRLYQIDPYRTTFESAVIRRFPEGERVGIVLEETCFYPTSGGQYADGGTLGGERVEDVRQDGEEIVHVLTSDPSGDRLVGKIDWTRRFDHMQQHSGQHVLSQSFLRILNLNTVSAHLGAEASTVELPAENLTRDDLNRVETEANGIVLECRPIHALEVSVDEARARGVRKLPERSGNLRIIEVADYDLSACGGTHCRSTGEIGLIKIAGTERIRKQTRVAFLCGWRALEDYRSRWRWLEEAARAVGRGASDLPGEVRKLMEDAARRKKEATRLEEEILGYRARSLLPDAQKVGGVRLVAVMAQDLSPEALSTLAGRLVSSPGVVALLGCAGEKGHLVAARSEDVDVDMSRLLQDVLSGRGGRGGGTPVFARGGLDRGRVKATLEDLRSLVESRIPTES